MVEMKFALDEAEFVRVETIGAVKSIWIWYGGTTVNVYSVIEGEAHDWKPVGTMTVQDSKGRAVEQDEIEKHIEMDIQRTREDWEEEF